MSYGPMTGKMVEAKVWAEACSVLCWVPNPVLSTPGGYAAGRWQDPSCCTYLGMQAPAGRKTLPVCCTHRHCKVPCHYYIV